VSKRILVVATAPVSGESLRARLRSRAGEAVDVRVVAPAADLSPLDWLANAEDDARGISAERAGKVEKAVEPEAESVEAEVGDTDPMQAIEDALRQFPADELLLVTRPQDEAGWLEEGTAEEALARFDLPITHLVVAED
jgi:hypothetical protein